MESDGFEATAYLRGNWQELGELTLSVDKLAPEFLLELLHALVSAGCVTLHISAARVKFSVLARARKYRTWWSSMDVHRRL